MCGATQEHVDVGKSSLSCIFEILIHPSESDKSGCFMIDNTVQAIFNEYRIIVRIKSSDNRIPSCT